MGSNFSFSSTSYIRCIRHHGYALGLRQPLYIWATPPNERRPILAKSHCIYSDSTACISGHITRRRDYFWSAQILQKLPKSNAWPIYVLEAYQKKD